MSYAIRTYLVIPCFNESERLRPTELLRFLHDNVAIGLILVDDGSSDPTWQVLNQLKSKAPEKISLIQLSSNQGKGEAVRQGVLKAISKEAIFVGYWDADLATPLDQLPFLLEQFSDPTIDVVMGSRVKLLGRQIERLALRHYIGRIFATMASWVLGLAVYDTQCGAKVFRCNDQLTRAFANPFISRWIFDVEIIARLANITGDVEAKIYEYPLHKWSDVKGSKLRGKDFIRAALDLFKIWRRYRSSVTAL